jgi:hypothetical protein
MRAERSLPVFCLMALAAATGISGCAVAPATLLGAGGDINFTSTTANRTFTYSLDKVHAAALEALERMQIAKIKDIRKGDAIKMQGKTRHLKILIDLATITPSVTKVSINAKKNWFMKDQSVAVEILIQMAKVLDHQPAA